MMWLLSMTIASCPLVVHKVVDGDTITVENSKGELIGVRLLGIDCPESYRNAKCRAKGKEKCDKEVTRGKAITEYVRSKIERSPVVWLEEIQGKDWWGRTLSYIRLKNGQDLGLDLIARGLCHEISAKYDHPRSPTYRLAAVTPPPL